MKSRACRVWIGVANGYRVTRSSARIFTSWYNWALVTVPTCTEATAIVAGGIAALKLNRTAVAILVRCIAGLTVFAVSSANAIFCALIAAVRAASAPTRTATGFLLAGSALEVPKTNTSGAFITGVLLITPSRRGPVRREVIGAELVASFRRLGALSTEALDNTSHSAAPAFPATGVVGGFTSRGPSATCFQTFAVKAYSDQTVSYSVTVQTCSKQHVPRPQVLYCFIVDIYQLWVHQEVGGSTCAAFTRTGAASASITAS